MSNRDNDVNQWQVLKFGGTSVSSKANWENIVCIIKNKLEHGQRVFVVHSALSGVSNKLEELIDEALIVGSDKYISALDDIINKHKVLLAELGLQDNYLDEHYQHLRRLIDGVSLLGEASDRIKAVIMAQGELWATLIGQAYLKEHCNPHPFWLDARQFMLSDGPSEDNYLAVSCGYQKDHQLLETVKSAQLVITQGFIGSNEAGETLLLGRGGSDTSAANFAAKISASRLEIWTDVPGVFTANPNQVQNARLLKHLDYDEAQEMASAGAKVLHPRTIRPLKTTKIPLYIRSTIEPEIEGTIIHELETKAGLIKAITAKQGITLISMESQGMWQQAGFLADLFAVFKKYQVSVDLVSTSETNVTVSLDSLTQVVHSKTLSKLSDELSSFCRVKILGNCSAVSIVGKNVRAILHKIAPALAIFETYKVYLLSQAASDLNLTFVIDDEHCNKVIASLHELLISNNPNSEILGPTAEELKQQEFISIEEKWWQQKVPTIESLMKDKESAYIYNLDKVKYNVLNLQSIKSVEQIYFAMKSNNNSQILDMVYEQGCGFETVSIHEVNTIIGKYPELDRSRIYFTPNFAQRREYQQAIQLGINLSLDSIYPLQNWAEDFANSKVFLRIDPDIGKGHHENVRTAGSTSKFGIPIYELETIKPILEQYNITVNGLHAHAGSGILTNEHWAEHAQLLAETAQKFPKVKFLNLGGGFGIKEREQQTELTMRDIDKALDSIKTQYPQYQFWIEPGRYITANAGILVAKVTQVKHKQNYYYVGLNTGMNSLMRPALYGSYHSIHNLTRFNDEKNMLATVVGPICESTDKLGVEIPFPVTQEGDLILIDNAGAYGYVMSNHYNMRPPAEEVCIASSE
ncbi:MAG: bifunctional aspartate kinase/diaminopimelate decarboxylase [Kangiellaceae bacterium]|nr:bifunctional aspartate kinase/diaminopimelate decarboxylase [Kangiellaceae bacterium]